MAVFIRSVGCDCPECGPDPCTAGCDCTFNEQANTTDGSTGTVSEDFAAGSNFVIAHTVYIDVVIDSGVLVFNLYADAVLVYTTGSIGAGTTSGSASIPAGTTTITAEFVISSAVGPATYADIYC